MTLGMRCEPGPGLGFAGRRCRAVGLPKGTSLKDSCSPGRSAVRLALGPFRAHPFAMLPDEQASPKQIEILRAMSGEQRLRLAERLYWSARQLKIAGLRAQHPAWSEDRLQAEVLRIFRHART